MKRLALISLVLAMVVGVAGAAPITYEEPFDGASDGTDAELSVAGWNAHGNLTDDSGQAIAVDLTSGDGDYKAGLGWDDGGIAYFWPGKKKIDEGIIWTDEQTLDRTSPGEIDTVAFDVNANNADETAYHLAMEIGSQWYVRKTGVSADNKKTWESKSVSFTTSAADWAELDFTPESALSFGSDLTSDLPAGDITAFGLYLDMNTGGDGSNGTMRVDNFTISQVPEPATMSLLAIGGLGVLIRRRK